MSLRASKHLYSSIATCLRKMRSKFIVGAATVGFVGVVWCFILFYSYLQWYFEEKGLFVDFEYAWIYRLLLNLAGYTCIMGPGYLLYKVLMKINYFDKLGGGAPGCVSRALYACFGPYARLGEAAAARAREAAAPRRYELAFCFTGLMAAYLVWGLLQEKIMTQKYVLSDGSTARFTDAQLLVLVNRLGALLAALAQLACSRRPALAAPLHKFSYCALTNVLSAWCQYEALKYVSFPTQVLSKSCKVIPVMLMGKLVSRAKYEAYEYLTAALISLGMAMFLFGSHADFTGTFSGGWVGTVAGALLLALYLGCDGFTSTWQAALFQQYALHPLQMLACVNVCSVALTATALTHTSHHLQLLQHPGFLVDCLVLSASSALGQLLIYRTIANFGAVVFAIIMTLRQAVSILLSCLVFGHGVSWLGGGGVALVFAAVLLRLYCAKRKAAGRAKGALRPPRTT